MRPGGPGRIATLLATLFCCTPSQSRADTLVLMSVGGDTVSLPSRGASATAVCEPCVRPPHVGDVMTVYAGRDRVRRDRGDQSIILRKDLMKLYLVCQSLKQYAELRYPVDAAEDPPKNRLSGAKDLSRYDFVAPGKTEEGTVQSWPVRTFSATVTNKLLDQYRLRVSVTRSDELAGTPVLELRKLLNEIERVGEGWGHLVSLLDGIPVIWEEAQREPESEFVYREEVTDMEEQNVPPSTYDVPSDYKKVKFHRECWQFR